MSRSEGSKLPTEQEIDEGVARLYGLSDEEMEIIKGENRGL
ncbi:MAG TPA: hypothetical protein VE956_02730 [Nodularia sp. (in: cyanobacteria)]|nr:hypothetical protein [Nodularia sp. (in: cyanobacteria)]